MAEPMLGSAPRKALILSVAEDVAAGAYWGISTFDVDKR